MEYFRIYERCEKLCPMSGQFTHRKCLYTKMRTLIFIKASPSHYTVSTSHYRKRCISTAVYIRYTHMPIPKMFVVFILKAFLLLSFTENILFSFRNKVSYLENLLWKHRLKIERRNNTYAVYDIFCIPPPIRG